MVKGKFLYRAASNPQVCQSALHLGTGFDSVATVTSVVLLVDRNVLSRLDVVIKHLSRTRLQISLAKHP